MKRNIQSTHSFRPLRTISRLMAMILVVVIGASVSFPVSAAVTGRVTASQIRSTVVSKMEAMSSVEWIATKAQSGITAGVKYKGIPYSQSYNTSYASFLSKINDQGKLTEVCGIDCSTAAVFAWLDAGALASDQYTYSGLSKWNTQTLVEKATNGSTSDAVIMVSGGPAISSSSDTKFVRNMSTTNYDNWLKNVKIGDILVRRDGSTGGHAIVVAKNDTTARKISVIEIGGGPTATQWNSRTLTYDSLHLPKNKAGGFMPITTTRMTSSNSFADISGTDGIKYNAHVQDIGWQGWKNGPIMAGTTGQSKRLEAIKIQLSGLCGSVRYKTHVQDIGWTGWSYDGAASGTVGQSKRVEAIAIELSGYAAANYSVYYRVHCQEFGWMGWAKDGAYAGTSGYGYRMEAIQIALVPRGTTPPGPMTTPFKSK